jgi:methionyl-tRNA formyltransferase
MKIAFFWTWEFSKNILKWIFNEWSIDVWLIVSQPDKPIWRKKTITPTPVKQLALEKNIKILQPEKLKNNTDFFNELNGFDFIVVVAYWKIVPNEVLNAPKYGCINIHWSILPKYRWASPIQEAIKNGDTKTWLTIMYMSEWMDEWDILAIEKIKIDIKDNTLDIFKKFESIGVNLLINTLNQIIKWKIKWHKQNNLKATYCSKILKQDWKIDFKNETAENIYNKFRSYTPWPWIFSFYNNKKLQIEDCFFENIDLSDDDELKIWDVVELESEFWAKNREIWVICNSWILILKQVKLEWKKRMDIISFINWNKEFLDYQF